MKLSRRGIFWTTLLLGSGPALAMDVHLIAAPFNKAMPDGTEVLMWGFAEDLNADGVLDAGETVQSPGPEITVPPGDPDLTIHLTNRLGEPTSLVIPGTTTAMAPVFFTDAEGRERVKSFTHETAPDTTGIYQWSGLAAGTRLYHSGTHPQKQVQMGLYGGLKKDAAAGEAYAGVTYTHETSLFFSEIDPALHAAVASGEYGTAAYPSTIDYAPKYFLVNGKPYEPGNSIPAGIAGQPLLLRLFNMGLKTHVPLLQGSHVQVVAEDGFACPYARAQYSVGLPAAKTKDVVLTPAHAGTLTLYDRRLFLSDAGQPGGGMLAKLEVLSQTGIPVAVPDGYTTDEDTLLSIAAPGLLANDTPTSGLSVVLAEEVTAGTLSLNADGSFTYEPPADFSGSAAFSYRADDGTLQSEPATVSITVNAVNDAPVGVADGYSTNAETALAVPAPGVLGNDTDPDGDALSANLINAPLNGSVELLADGSFTYTPNAGFAGDDGFTYEAHDGSLGSGPVSVTVSVASAANQPPIAVDDSASTPAREAVTVNVTSNDSDPDGTLNLLSVTVTTQPLQGTAVGNGDGTVTYTPNLGFRGTDAFGYTVEDDEGAVSNEATVRINVTR